MRPSESVELVTRLRDAYPNSTVGEGTLEVYARSLADFSVGEAVRAIDTWIATQRFLPAVGELREAVIEQRLGLPSVDDAWLAATERPADVPREPCVACAGFGTRLYEPGDDERPLAEIACAKCNGTGEVLVGPLPQLNLVVLRALNAVGGRWAIRQSDRPEVIRAQFMRTYERLRAEEIKTANLVSLGVLELAARRLALEEGS